MSLKIVDGPTIPHNESLSDGVDSSEGTIVRITVPQEFTEANLTFQTSSDGGMYNDLYDDKGEEVTVPAHPDTTIAVSGAWVRSIGWLKIRSGTREAPVDQRKDECKLAVALEVRDVGGTAGAMASGRGGRYVVVPTQLKLLRGNPGKRPIKPEPQPRVAEGVPEPPAHLTDDARLEWERIAPELYRLGLLTVLDTQTLVAYCDAYGRMMTCKRAIALMAAKDPLTRGLMIKTTNGNVIQNPLVGTMNKAALNMVRYASEFGLSPCARTRLSSSGRQASPVSSTA